MNFVWASLIGAERPARRPAPKRDCSPEENTDYSFSGAERATRRPAPERARSPENSGNFRTHLRRSRAHWRTDLKCSLNSGEACVRPRKRLTLRYCRIYQFYHKKRAPAISGGSSLVCHLLCVFCFVWKRGLCAAFWPPLGPCWFLTRVPLLRAATGFFCCGAAAFVPSFNRKG